jgi:hypothetical protein
MKIFLSPINFRIFGVSSANLKIFMTKDILVMVDYNLILLIA